MSGKTFELAQANVARMRAPLEHETMRGFVERLARVNAMADAAPGFVWRLQTETGDATSVRAFEDERILFNMSVWVDVESLRAYVYSGAHLEAFRGREAWFEPLGRSPQVMWWVRAGERPTPAEGRRRLEALWRDGPGPEGFGFARSWPPPGLRHPEVDG